MNTATDPTAMTIGGLSRAAAVSVETIRFYEREGLLPEPARARNGYRQCSGHGPVESSP